MSRWLRFAGLVIPALAPAALACQICVPFPKKSAADYLIEADAVVLAREDPDRPFHFRAIEVLRGRPGEELIDLFLDSSTRRQLAHFPSRSVVLVRRTADGKASWKRIATVDGETEAVVRTVLESASAWQEDPRQRVAFFADRLGHADRQLRDLAHLEVARAPYRRIRELGGMLTREEIYAFLGNVRYMEWHALHILLLAQSGHEDDRGFIRESLRKAARSGATTRLAAWATAAIELEQEAAVAFIEREYFRNPDRKPGEVKAVWQALSVHGTNGHVVLRDRIVESYRALLETHPGLTAEVAGDLIAWERTEYGDRIAKFATGKPKGVDFAMLMRLRRYARQTPDL